MISTRASTFIVIPTLAAQNTIATTLLCDIVFCAASVGITMKVEALVEII
jgi:hypothetical protein